MERAVSVAKDDLASVRTGRATPNMFSRIAVDYYGAMTPINQLASINIPEARMVIIKPYDQGSLKNLEKAIRDSDLGVNPSNDGQIIRIVVPQLSEERRREMVKVARGKGEDARVTIRSLRRKAMEELHRIVRGRRGGRGRGRPRREGAAGHRRPVRPPDRRAGEAQGSRAARGLMTASHPDTPAMSAAPRCKQRAQGPGLRACGPQPRRRDRRRRRARRGGAGVAAHRAALVHRRRRVGRRGRHLGAGRGAAPRRRHPGSAAGAARRRAGDGVAGLAVRARGHRGRVRGHRARRAALADARRAPSTTSATSRRGCSPPRTCRCSARSPR